MSTSPRKRAASRRDNAKLALAGAVVLAAIYTRKSNIDERSHKDGKSIGLVFADDAISGAEFVNRPGYQRMMEAALKGQFRGLVMMALNRLGRDQARVMMALTDLHDAGVAVWTYQRGIEVKLDTAQDILIASVEAFADAAYRESIRLNTREALRKKADRTGQRSCQKSEPADES